MIVYLYYNLILLILQRIDTVYRKETGKNLCFWNLDKIVYVLKEKRWGRESVFMKRKLSLLFCVCILFGISTGCKKETFALDDKEKAQEISYIPLEEKQIQEEEATKQKEKLSLMSGRKVYPFGVKEISLFYQNNTDKMYIYGEEIILEENKNGSWVFVEPEAGFGWHEIGITLNPYSSSKQTVSLSAFENNLKAGHYRLVKKLFPDSEGPIEERLTLTAEFTVQKKEETKEVYLLIEKEKISIDTDTIFYSLVNESGKELFILLAPQLEKMAEGKWQPVETLVGFCGVMDPFNETMKGEIPLKEWYPSLETGIYQVSFSFSDENGKSSMITDQFEIQ